MNTSSNTVIEYRGFARPCWHRGFVIKPIFFYGKGIYDIEYYKFNDPEISGIVARGTFDKARQEINEYLYAQS